jgi:hypothetical protein
MALLNIDWWNYFFPSFNEEFVERRCSSEGRWQVKPGSNSNNTQGWTNYTSCYTPEILELMMKLGNDSVKEVSR